MVKPGRDRTFPWEGIILPPKPEHPLVIPVQDILKVHCCKTLLRITGSEQDKRDTVWS